MDSTLYDDDDDVVDVYKRTNRQRAEEEINSYREMPKSKAPLEFWKKNVYTLPNLSKMAMKYLVVKATSVAAERVFSSSGDILSVERSCLDIDSLDAIIFLKSECFKEL